MHEAALTTGLRVGIPAFLRCVDLTEYRICAWFEMFLNQPMASLQLEFGILRAYQFSLVLKELRSDPEFFVTVDEHSGDANLGILPVEQAQALFNCSIPIQRSC